MKLDAIDEMVAARSRFHQLHTRVKAVTQGLFHVTCGMNTGQVTFGRNEHKAALEAAQAAMLPILQKELDEQKSRLMLMGITEFPE